MTFDEPGSDTRAGHALDAAVCDPHDPGGSAAAVLQRGRHPDRGPLRRHRRAGGGRLVLFPDDFPDLHPAGAVHGQRGAVFDALRPAGRRRPAGEPCVLLCPDRGGDGGAEHRRLCLSGPDPDLSTGAGPGLGADAQLPDHYLCRHPGRLSVQLFRLFPAGGGQQRRAAGLPGGVGPAEHRARPLVRAGAGPRRGRRGGGHRHFAIRLGHRHPGLHPGPPQRVPGPGPAPAPPRRLPAGGGELLLPDLRPAVGDEPGHPDGAGAGEQLRSHHHGGLCGSGQDRLLRLPAGAGFRQRLFHLHCPELRRQAV